MPIIIDYILKLNICLAVVYLFYQLFLRRLTFYNWNRWYLLGYTLLSFIIPLIDIMPSLEKRALQQNVMVQWIPAITFAGPEEKGFFETLTYWDWAIAILAVGSVFLLSRFLLRFYSFRKMRAKAQLISGQDTLIYQLDEPITPFSFGNAIFINTELHSGEDLEEIIRHEFVHVKQRHTIDILWCELLCMLNWFNPFVWLLKHNVKQNLEFIADNKVLQSGLDRKEYQYLLLKVMGNRQFAFTNHFNFSSLKKRIAMMNSMKSARVQLVKFMFLLPVVAVLLLSFRKEIRAYQQESALIKAGDTTQQTADETAADVSIQPLETRDTVPAKRAGDPPTITLRNQITVTDPDKKPLIIVDGKSQTAGYDLENINPDHIKSIEVLKEGSAVTEYGDAAKNGVVKITTKEAATKSPVLILRGASTGRNPLFILDGVKIDEEEMSQLNPDNIESITVLKDASAKAVYGEAAVDGVVLVKTKQENKTTTVNLKHSLTVNEPVYVVDGQPTKKADAARISAVDIKSVMVAKDSAVKAMYGTGKEDGVIFITTQTGATEATKNKPADVVVVGYGKTPAGQPPLKGKVTGVQLKSPSDMREVTVTGYGVKRSAANANVLADPPQNAHYVLNGESVSVDKIRKLRGDSVKSVDILKGENATRYYGAKAKEGAIVITTK